MEIIAEAKNVRVSPRKVRLVADAISKMPLEMAVARLYLMAKSAAIPIRKVLESALANAVNNGKLSKENLTIKAILVGEGFKMKRRDMRRNAKVDVGLIQKRTSHIKVILTDKKNGK